MSKAIILVCIIGLIIILMSVLADTTEMFTACIPLTDHQQIIFPLTSAILAAGAASLYALGEECQKPKKVIMTLDEAYDYSQTANKESKKSYAELRKNIEAVNKELDKMEGDAPPDLPLGG
jgi:peptidoglycan hydrolase CwlO-like protein